MSTARQQRLVRSVLEQVRIIKQFHPKTKNLALNWEQIAAFGSVYHVKYIGKEIGLRSHRSLEIARIETGMCVYER